MLIIVIIEAVSELLVLRALGSIRSESFGPRVLIRESEAISRPIINNLNPTGSRSYELTARIHWTLAQQRPTFCW